MAVNLRMTEEAVKAELDGINALPNSGKLRIYDGSQPTDPDAAIAGSVTDVPKVISVVGSGHYDMPRKKLPRVDKPDPLPQLISAEMSSCQAAQTSEGSGTVTAVPESITAPQVVSAPVVAQAEPHVEVQSVGAKPVVAGQPPKIIRVTDVGAKITEDDDEDVSLCVVAFLTSIYRRVA